ncbi:MAG: HAMP domain-containing sensor histidine kinase [Corynebacterium sp.]|nr:HAMP domain-containing sensor histidine kinase [Corynebacterium sp.]
MSFRVKSRDGSLPKAIPLRVGLVVIIVLISGLGLAGSSAVVSAIMRDVLYNRVDQDLLEAERSWARNVDFFGVDMAGAPPTEFCLIRVLPDGSLRLRNPYDSMPQVDDLIIGGAPRTVASTRDSEQPSEWRALATENNGGILIVAKNLDSEKTVLQGLAILQVLVTIVSLVLIAIAGFYAIRRALRPLRVVEKTATDIAAGEVDKRVPQWPMRTEVGQLSAALNIMLGQLQNSIEQAQEKEKQMRRFVGDASHELRTPLTSLRGYAELYRSGITNDADMVLDKIHSEAERMSLLVEDLLALTRAEGSRLELRTVDVLELALNVASTARGAFPGREIKVSNHASGIPMVQGDPSRLHQVVLNLVSNGLKHGGDNAVVVIELARDNTDVLIRVIDSGKGMSADDAAHIFERFYRTDSSRTRDTGGSGLGLAIAKSLIEQHGGTIWVESELGQGSTFTVRIPALIDETETSYSHTAEDSEPSDHRGGDELTDASLAAARNKAGRKARGAFLPKLGKRDKTNSKLNKE